MAAAMAGGAGRVHVVGAGLAGLAAALRLAEAGREVVLYEAGRQAGGRCRSYFDGELGCRLDNGNHLLLAGNQAALGYLERIGAAATMVGPLAPRFDFYDCRDGLRWVLEPGGGRLPWWILDRRRRVPGTRAADYLQLVRLAGARPDETVPARLDGGSVLYRRLLQPFAVAALNTECEAGSAALLWHVFRESFGAGGAALRPLVPRDGHSESFVDPALARLAALGCAVRFGARLRRIGLAGQAAVDLDFDEGSVPLGPGDAMVLAVPAPIAARLLPGLIVPTEFRAILNAHYRIPTPADRPPFIGLVGGLAEWVFRKSGILSVTVSAADRLIDEPAEALAEHLWQDVARAYALAPAPLPAWRIVKERRATFAAIPEQLRRRPPAATPWRNLVLAGDWTATGLPATIEGAIRSGESAAALLTSMPRQTLVAGDQTTQPRRKMA